MQQEDLEQDDKVKILNLYHITTPPISRCEDVETDLRYPDRLKLATAPHTVNMMGTGFMAVDRRCLVKGDVILPRQPRNVLEHQIVNLPDHSNELQTLDILREFIQQLRVHNVYEIDIAQPFDCNGQLAVIPVLVAVWKFLIASETGICDEETFREILNGVIDKFELEIGARNTVLDATLQGSQDLVHINTEEEDEDSKKAPVTIFNENYDLVFARTDLHTSDFKHSLYASEEFAETLRDGFYHDIEDSDDYPDPDAVPSLMTAYSKTRIERREYQEIDIEVDCQMALERLVGEEDRLIEGFEVQQGGALIILKKGVFRNEEKLRAICTAIASESRRAISKISFDLLKPAAGAASVTIDDIDNFEDEESAVSHLEVKINSPSHTSSSGQTCMEGEEDSDESDNGEADDSEDDEVAGLQGDHDDTFDEDEEE